MNSCYVLGHLEEVAIMVDGPNVCAPAELKMKAFGRVAAWVSHNFLSELKHQWQEINEEALIEGVAEKTGLSVMFTADQQWQFEGDWHSIDRAQKILDFYVLNGLREFSDDDLDPKVSRVSLSQADVHVQTDNLLPPPDFTHQPAVTHASRPNTEVGVQTDLLPPEWIQGPFVTGAVPSKKKQYKPKKRYVPTGRPRGRPKKQFCSESEVVPPAPNVMPSLSTVIPTQDAIVEDDLQSFIDNELGNLDNVEVIPPVDGENNFIEKRRTRKIIDYSLVEGEGDFPMDDESRSGRKRRGRRKGVPFKRPYIKRNKSTVSSPSDGHKRRGRPRIIEPGTKWPCPQCDYISNTKSGLKNHEQRKHQDRRYDCKICNKTFGLHHDLQRHVKSHTEISVCEMCGKQYKTPSQLIIHRLRHDPNYTKPEPIPCELCGKMFSGTISLKWHVESIHKGNRKTFLCNFCGKAFLAKTKMEDHENLHTGRRPYICSICGANFAHSSSLSSHMLIHSGLKKYRCMTCSKMFRTSNNLRTHQQIHTGNPRFKCDHCGKAFYQKQALIRHKRIHTGEKPFQCELCGDKFNVKSILNRHLTGVHKLNLGPPGHPGRPAGSTMVPSHPTTNAGTAATVTADTDTGVVVSMDVRLTNPDQTQSMQTYLPQNIQQIPLQLVPQPTPCMPSAIHHPPQSNTPMSVKSDDMASLPDVVIGNHHYTIPLVTTNTETHVTKTTQHTLPLTHMVAVPHEHSHIHTHVAHPAMAPPPMAHQVYQAAVPPATTSPNTHTLQPMAYPAHMVPTSQANPAVVTDPSSSYQQASDMLATLAASMALHTMSAMGQQ